MGSRFRVHDNGSLLIQDVQEDDAGAYSCWVENAQGKTAITASLDVRSEWLTPMAQCPLFPASTLGPGPGPCSEFPGDSLVKVSVSPKTLL